MKCASVLSTQLEKVEKKEHLKVSGRMTDRIRSSKERLISISFTFRSENLFRTMADLVVSEGYAEVGYEYINVDDCWLEKTRGNRGELVADRKRFPRGMKALGEYVSVENCSIQPQQIINFSPSLFLPLHHHKSITRRFIRGV